MVSSAVRRPALVLSLLLSGCVLLLSLQVRRVGGQTLAEEWLLDATGVLVRGVSALRDSKESVLDWVATRARLIRENGDLRARVLSLEGDLLRLRDAERDRNRLSELLGVVPGPPPGTRPARLILVETAGPFQSALLDRGRAAGIEAGSVVVGLKGLLGRVVVTGETTARVQLLSDRTAAVGVLFARTGRDAVARGDGSTGVSVQYVPTISDIVPEDVLVTSGTDGVYPRDLPVGRIAAVRRAGHSLFLDLPVRVSADPRNESLVFVLPPVLPVEARPGAGPTSVRP